MTVVRQGIIEEVVFASYGMPTGQCGAFVAENSCAHPHTTTHVEAACLGKTFCTLPVRTYCKSTRIAVFYNLCCSGQVEPSAFGSSEHEDCAPAGHAQRVHAQVVCSVPAKLQVSANV